MSTTMTSEVEQRIAALERDVAELKNRAPGASVRPLLKPRMINPREIGLLSEADMWEFLALNGLEGDFARVKSLTEELFLGIQSIEYMYDPENPSDQFVVVAAEAKGTTEKLLHLRREWNRQVLEIAPNHPTVFCLSIAVVP